MKSRRFLSAMLAGTIAVVVSLAGISPASAAMDTNCGLSVTAPTSDGTSVYTTASVGCSTYMDYTAVQVGIKIQEKVAVVWTNRTDWSYIYSAGATSLAKPGSVSCNGHGTDVWRGNGYGKTSDGGASTADGASRSITC